VWVATHTDTTDELLYSSHWLLRGGLLQGGLL